MPSLAKYFTAKAIRGQYAESKRKHLKNDCVAMGPSERFDYIVSIFSESFLRRSSDYLDADISMMTVHSAKGLERDTVFIPGVTRFDWPGGICSRCESAGMCSRSAHGCRIVDAKKIPDGLIEEMGLLYVGVTRARKAVCVSASMQRRTNSGSYQVACPLLSNVSSGHRTRELDGHGRGGVICGGMSVPSIGVRSGQWFLLWSHGVCSSCSLARTVWTLASWWVRCLFN